MNCRWLDAYCSAKPGCCKEHKDSWKADLYLVGGKIFVLRFHDKSGREIVNLKMQPDYGALMRLDYFPDVIPAYHMNKLHWVSVYLDGRVPAKAFKEMIDESYARVLATLSRKKRAEIQNGQG